MSEDEMSNIKIGDTVIANNIQSGATKQYYFFKDITGQYTANDAISGGYSTYYDVNRNAVVERSGTYTLRAGNYFFESEIFRQGDETYITLRCVRHNSNWANDDFDEYINNEFYQE